MNKVMVSGLALGKDPKLDVCQVCNFDLSWLVNNPSTLLWIDQIILTPEIYESIKNAHEYEGELGKAYSIVFERLESLRLIDIRKVSDVIDKSDSEKIYKQIIQDKKSLLKYFPDNVKRDKASKTIEHLYINEDEYCDPSLWTIYASIELSKKWGANLILPDYSYNYLKYKIGLASAKLQIQKEKIRAFDKIFSSKLPESLLFPAILFSAKICKTCDKNSSCKTDSISIVEKNLNTLMEWRDYDEIIQLRGVLDQISKQVTQNIKATTDDFIQAFHSEEAKIKRKIRKVFPKIERWANLITIMSVPIIVTGVSTGSAPTAVIGAATAGVATIANKYIDTLKSKYRWVGFRHQM